MNDNDASFRRETTRVAAVSSLVSDKRKYSLVKNYENMPRRVNRWNIVSARNLPETFVGDFCICSVIYARQMCGYYLRQTTRMAADSSLVIEK